MSTTIRPSNGKPAQSNLPPDLLAFLNVDQNINRRVSVNSAWTYRRTTDQFDLAILLVNGLADDYKHRRPKESIDLDSLDTKEIVTAVEQRLQGVPEVAEIPADELERRQQLLRELSGHKATKAVRQVSEITAATVTQAVTPIRNTLHSMLLEAPQTFQQMTDGLERALRDLSYPVPDFASHKRFGNAIRALESLTRGSVLAPKIRETVVSSLRKRCEAEYQAALDAVLLGYAAEALSEAVAALLPYVDELRAGQAMFSRNFGHVRKHLDDQRTAARHRSVQSRSSVLLELETPDQDQLLAGIRDQHRCADRAALIHLFAEKLTETLNETARQRYAFINTPATLTELVMQLPSVESASGVANVVGTLVGDLHTVYTAVRSYGVRRAARELFERAAPLCHLDSRDNVRLNVETHRDLIVRLPRPRGADDAEIAEQLRAAFGELQRACQFHEDPLETEITIVRTLVGFPIGIEATNVPMLIDYAASKEQDHPPHLFGLLPESPDGRHVPRLLALARHHLQR